MAAEGSQHRSQNCKRSHLQGGSLDRSLLLDLRTPCRVSSLHGLEPGTGFMEDSFSMDWHWDWGNDGSGDNTSDGEQQMKLHQLNSCCEAWFLTGSWTSIDLS